MVHLGESLDEEALDAASDKVAEYLYLNAVTEAGTFFDLCRESAASDEPESPQGVFVRTFGLCPLNAASAAASTEEASALLQEDQPQCVEEAKPKDAAAAADRLVDCFREASPLPACGGKRRLLLVLPNGAASDSLNHELPETLKSKLTIAHSPASGGVACCEVEQVLVDELAAELTKNLPESREIASRLHTRRDVSWL